jgi:hypothetical protein
MLGARGAFERKKHTIKLPITGGRANPPNYVLNYAGGIKLRDEGRIVTITKLVANTTTFNVTGVIDTP